MKIQRRVIRSGRTALDHYDMMVQRAEQAGVTRRFGQEKNQNRSSAEL